MSKKENKRKSNLKLLLLLLLLTAVLLVASTYAWFTANRIVTISQIDVTVEAKSGLQISADGATWKSILLGSDFNPLADGSTINTTYEANVNQIPTELEPVSTIKAEDAENPGHLAMYYGVTSTDATTGQTTLTATKLTEARSDVETPAAGKFIAFDIFLRTTQAIPNLQLMVDSDVTYKTGAAENGLKNAARVAFVVEGTVEDGSTKAVVQAINSTTDSPAAIYFWEPNYDTHTAAAIANADSVYGVTTSSTGGSLLTYNGIKAPITTPVLLNSTDSNYFASVTADYKTPSGNGDNGAAVNIFGLPAGITKIRVYMWVEGQDVDCENNASGSGLSFNVKIQQPEGTTEASSEEP